ncbi:hypothetical protein EHS25_001812 [Saitozyma podzolica]|uniref:Cyclin N-terminal domain-containing protein n=1 Tax=Saitozyma podzolica TaxID=1890683 RepID=A0A427YFF7_9TREE|nr:hypothetical protein EHS25_001812 [Saitozyma podzolica]
MSSSFLSNLAGKTSASASAPASRASARLAEPYYGLEETSMLCARFITSLFQCPKIPTATHLGKPTPLLAHFVAYALYRTRLSSIVTFAALLLLQRLKTRHPAARGSSGHRLFISAFMIASKVICDDTYSNQSWVIVAQNMFALQEINQMERELCAYLEWNLNVQGEEVVEFEARIRSEHGSKAIATSSPSPGPTSVLPVNAYSGPETKGDPNRSQPIQQVPSPYTLRLQQISPHFATAVSSLASSPVSDDCRTPTAATVIASSCRSMKSLSLAHVRQQGTTKLVHTRAMHTGPKPQSQFEVVGRL